MATTADLKIITPPATFLMFEEAILNVNDISTVRPYREDGLRWHGSPDPYDGVRVTMQSKVTHVDLPGQTMAGFASLLSGSPF